MMTRLVVAALLYCAAICSPWAQEFHYLTGKPNPGGAATPAGVSGSCSPQGSRQLFVLSNNSGQPVTCLYGCYDRQIKKGIFKPGTTRVTIEPLAESTPTSTRLVANCVLP